MKSKFRLGSLTLALLLSPVARTVRAENAGNTPSSTEQSDNEYYWKEKNFNNLDRLGKSFDGFEKSVQKKQDSKESESYLLQIREEMVNTAKQRSQERATLNYGGNSPDSALNVAYLEKGHIKVTIQAKYLFDENTASFKPASMDVIDRLAGLLATNQGNQVDLTMIDELDSMFNAKDIDAERTLAVFSLLNFKKLANSSS